MVHLERMGVHNGNFVLIFKINIDMAFAVTGRLFGSAAEVDGADDGAVLGVDGSNIGARCGWRGCKCVRWRARKECRQGGLSASMVLIVVRACRIPHDYRPAAAKAVVGFGIDGALSMHTGGVGDFTGGLEGIEVEKTVMRLPH